MVTMRANTRVEIDQANLDRVVGLGLKKDITRRTAHARASSRRFVKSRSGKLKRAVEYDISGSRLRWVGRVYVNDAIARSPRTAYDRGGSAYGLAVHNGTAGRGAGRIHPRGSHLMVPATQGSSRYVRRKSVRGQKPNRFLVKGLEAAAT